MDSSLSNSHFLEEARKKYIGTSWFPSKLQETVRLQLTQSPVLKGGKFLFYTKTGHNAGIVMYGIRKLHIIDTNFSIVNIVNSDSVTGLFTGIGMLDSNWFLTAYNGIFIYNSKSNQLIRKISLKEYIPSNIMYDNFGGCWITTVNKGVFYKPNQAITTKSFPKKVSRGGMTNYARNDQVQVIGTQSKVVSVISRKRQEINYFNDMDIQNVKFNQNKFYIAANDDAFILKSNGELERELESIVQINLKNTNIQDFKGYFDILEMSDGAIISCAKECVFKDTIPSCIPNAQRLTSLHKFNDTIWAGGMKGLFAYNPEKHDIQNFGNDSLLNNRINYVSSLKKLLLLATRGAGIIVKQGKQLYQIQKQDGLVSNSISKIVTDGGKNIWVSSNNGISKIHVNSIEPFTYTLSRLDEKDGIFSNQIQDIQLFKDSLFILTSKELYSVHKDYEAAKSNPILYFTDITRNNKIISHKSSFNFDYKTTRLEFSFLGIYFPDPNGLLYSYSSDFGKTWNTTKNKSISFLNLPKGDYSFFIKVIAPNGSESNVKKIKFSIHPPWWLTWWAQIIYALILIGLTSLVLILRFRFLKKQEASKMKRSQEKEQNKRKVIELELKALRAQMNPHFTFNTMNSIQHFINNNESEKANNYISKFSKLMRMILDNSIEEYITVERELLALETYLQIESLRLSDKFNFSITVDELIDESYEKIPPLVIQPYCENSIWHGLMSKEGDKIS